MLPLVSPFGLCPPVLSRPVQRGPILIGIPGISGVAVNNGTTPATAAPPVSWRWPMDLIVREWILIPQSGTPADAGKLGIRMVDQDGETIFDGVGLDASSNFLNPLTDAGITPSGFHLTGWSWSPQWLKLARLVRQGEQWQFQLTNAKTGGGSITPRLLFAVELPLHEPPPQASGRLNR